MENGRRLLDSMRSTNDAVCASKLRHEAISCFQRGLGVTNDMEKNLIAALRKLNVSTVVAPYEADCQLAHLCDVGICQGVLTEDSDVLVYSAVCGKAFPILYKFDKNSESVQTIHLDQLMSFSEHVFESSSNSTEESSQSVESSATDSSNVTSQSSKSEDKSFMKQLRQFSGAKGRRMFVQMCVLAGCDYSDSIHGVGLMSAQQVSKHLSFVAPYHITICQCHRLL